MSIAAERDRFVAPEQPTAPQSSALPRSIVLVGPLPPPAGGMANQTRQLAALLTGEGVDVRVVRTNARYRPGWIARARGIRAAFRLIPYCLALWRATKGASLVHVMANSGWSWHLFAAPAVWIAASRRIPTIVNYRGGAAREFLRRQRWLVRPTLARATLVIVPSTFLAGVFNEHAIRTVVVPNIVNVEAFRPAAARPESPHLLVTRNLEKIYDIATALRAFGFVVQRFPSARLTIAGEGPERASLERLAHASGMADQVRFTGRIDNAELGALYREATVAVNPSLIDNMPISVLEALASGVPVVSTHVGGVPHLVKHGETALLVPPDDPAAMADSIIRLLENPVLAAHLAANGLVHVKSFSWPAVRNRLLAAYAEATDARAAQAG